MKKLMISFINKVRKVKISLDKLFLYTFFALLLKSIFFVSFMYDQTHYAPDFRNALIQLFVRYAYRPFYYCGFILIFLSLTLFFKKRGRLFSLIIVNFIFSILFLIDLWYLRGFSTLPTLHMLDMKSNLDNTFSSITAVMKSIDILFLIDIPVLLVFAFVRKTFYRKGSNNFLLAGITLVVSICLVIFGAPMINDVTQKVPNAWIFNSYDMSGTAFNISPIGYSVYSSYTYWKDSKPVTLTNEEKNKIHTWFDNKKETLPDNEYKAMFKGKNLIVIQVESLEKFVINQKVNGQEITPNLNKLLKNSLYFSGVHQQNGEGMSSDADLMLNTSVYPIQRGTTFYSYPFTEYNSLPKLLKKLGYFTTAYHPDNGAFWNWMPALSSIGFDQCIDSTHYDQSEQIILGISDGSYLKQIEPMILKQIKPFYTFLVTLSSHTPFTLPFQFKAMDLGYKLDNSTIGHYFQCINYTDRQLGNFFDQLEKDGLLDDSVVVIYGDHEGLHKYFPQDVINYTPFESWWLDNKMQLPLIVYSKQLQGKEIKTLGGQVDILPTISYLMGVDEKDYINSAMGRNLLKTKKDFVVLRDRTYLSNQPDDKEKAAAIEGLDIADKIIRGNYFEANK